MVSTPASDYEVSDLNPNEGGVQFMMAALYCTEPFIITSSLSCYDLDNVERDMKYQPYNPLKQRICIIIAPL